MPGSVFSLFLLTVSIQAEDYEYRDTDEAGSLRPPGGGARLVNARAAAPDTLEFVGAFYLSSAPALVLPTCSAALITPSVALRCPP